MTYRVIRLMAWLRLAWEGREPPAAVLAAARPVERKGQADPAVSLRPPRFRSGQAQNGDGQTGLGGLLCPD